MDISSLLALVPIAWIPYVTGAIAIAAFVGMFMPAPQATSGIYYTAYQVISTLALNALHARNLSAPESKGVVGGPGAISAPQVSISSVPAPSSQGTKV